jgi:integrase
MTYRALELIILTATRAGEVLDAKWDEFDLDAKVWTIPAARMKAGKEHRVPLSAPAMELLLKRKEENEIAGLATVPWGKPSENVFPGKRAATISDQLVLRHLKAMNVGKVTVHGFRSTFKDWASEHDFPNEISEMALAHKVGTAVERAYKRTDLFEKRAKLMDAWADYLSTPAAPNVVQSQRA